MDRSRLCPQAKAVAETVSQRSNVFASRDDELWKADISHETTLNSTRQAKISRLKHGPEHPAMLTHWVGVLCVT
jgi:hypothetical protein